MYPWNGGRLQGKAPLRKATREDDGVFVSTNVNLIAWTVYERVCLLLHGASLQNTPVQGEKVPQIGKAEKYMDGAVSLLGDF